MQKKIIKYIFFTIFIFCFYTFKVNAEDFLRTICNIGTTDGLLYSNQWNFDIRKGKTPLDNKEQYTWHFESTEVRICPEGGCTGNTSWSTKQSGTGLDSLFKNSAFYNLFSTDTKDVSGVYTNSQLKSLLEQGSCPRYIYLGSSSTKQKIGFIFSSKKIDNAKELLENDGFVVGFTQDGGSSLTDEHKKNYETHVKKMKDNIEEFKNKNYGTVYNEECSMVSKFGQISIGENLVVNYYDKYKQDLFNANSSYDFSSGDKVLEEYKTYKCASKPSGDDFAYNEGTEVTGCEVVPEVIRKWIKIALNFVKYVALVLVIVLGTIDFIKAAASGEPDAMKKAGQSFVKRVVAVIILFLLPMIVDLLLNLIDLFGANTDCFGVLE